MPVNAADEDGLIPPVINCFCFFKLYIRSCLLALRSDVVLQCVAVRCSVLQCVAVCCSVLQCVAVRIPCCCSCLLTSRSDGGLQWVAEWCSALQYVAVRVTYGCSCLVLHKVMVCCSVLQSGAVRCSVLQCVYRMVARVFSHHAVMVYCRVMQCVAVWCSALQCVAVRGAYVCSCLLPFRHSVIVSTR